MFSDTISKNQYRFSMIYDWKSNYQFLMISPPGEWIPVGPEAWGATGDAGPEHGDEGMLE